MKISKWVMKVLLVCTLAAVASAATIVPSSGSITSTLVVDINTQAVLAFDVRSTAVLDVFDPGFLGSVPLSDGGAPAPNNTLTAYNSGFTESGTLTLAGLTGTFVGLDYLVASTGSPIGTVTDPALTEVLGPLTFDFVVQSAAPIDANTFGFTMNLNQILGPSQATPEPATLSITLGALLVGAAWRRRSRAR